MSDQSIRARVLALVNDEGVTTEGLANKLGLAWTTVQKAMAFLSSTDQVKKAKIGHKTVWYFLTQEAADSFKVKKAKRADIPPAVSVVKTKTSFEKGAQIVIPPHVKPQECPPFKGLGFADEPGKVCGGFATMGVGRYLADEDRRLARKAA